METYLIISAIILFLSYVGILTLIGGFKTDLTHLIYTIEDKWGRGWMWITTAVYLICAGVLFYVAINDSTKWLLAISSVAFALIGVFPDVRKNTKTKNVIHVGGAFLAITAGVLSSIIELNSWWLGVSFILFMIALKKQFIQIKHLTYWVELYAFFVITLATLRKKK